MSASFDPSENIENYILVVEKKEKRMRAIKISVTVILIFASATLAYVKGYHPAHSSQSYPEYFASEVSFEFVDSLLMDSPKPILIKMEGSGGFDTIRGIEDYIQFELDANPELAVLDGIQDEFIEDALLYATDRSSYQSKNVALDIIGERTVGNRLSFKIIPLVGNSLPLYEIDFGNGLKKKVKSSIRYSYPQEGDYFVYIRSTERQPQILCKLPIQIAKGSSMAIQERDSDKRPLILPGAEKQDSPFSHTQNIEVEKLTQPQATF